MSTSQILSLILCTVFFIPSIYLCRVSKPEARAIYCLMSFGWLGGIIFYVVLSVSPYTNVGMHDWSSKLRLFQYICFGTWTLFTSAEKFCGSDGCQQIRKTIDAKVRIWKQNFKLPLSR